MEGIYKKEIDRNSVNQIEEEYMKIRLDFYGRYGQAGKKIRQKLIKDKWNKLKKVAKDRK